MARETEGKPWLLIAVKLGNGSETLHSVYLKGLGNTAHWSPVGNIVERAETLKRRVNKTPKQLVNKSNIVRLETIAAHLDQSRNAIAPGNKRSLCSFPHRLLRGKGSTGLTELMIF